jgi:hypothetical protein
MIFPFFQNQRTTIKKKQFPTSLAGNKTFNSIEIITDQNLFFFHPTHSFAYTLIRHFPPQPPLALTKRKTRPTPLDRNDSSALNHTITVSREHNK